MKKGLVIVLIMILFVGGIAGLIIKNNEEKLYTAIFDNNEKIDCFIIRFKEESVKITGDDEIDAIYNMLDEKVKRDKSLDDIKGWIYEITAMDSSDNKLETLLVLDDTTIRLNGKTYSCKKIDISKIDELTGIIRR